MRERRAAVIGLGLMGASIAGALRRRGYVVRGTDCNAAASAVALDRQLVDSVEADLQSALDGVAVVVLAVPVGAIVRLLPEIDAAADRETVILDVGSVKAPVIQAMAGLPGAARAIGGHPIAGKETSGPQAADPSMFEGRPFALVPSGATDEAATHYARSLVTELGALPVFLTAAEHDEIVGRTSHLAQLLSIALVLSLSDGDDRLAGPGLRDMTRLAASPWSVWRDILSLNSSNIVTALDECAGQLARLRRLIADSDGERMEEAMLLANTVAARVATSVPA